jgi:membrane protease YdiL (CAAX protease family)
MRQGRDWREWALLTAAGTLGWSAAIPALWAQVEPIVRAQALPAPAFLALQFVQSGVQIAILVAAGLFFAHRAGLGAPVLDGWLRGEKAGATLKSILVPSILTGIGGAVVTIAVDRLVFMPLLPGFSTIITRVGGWQGVLASFYGGILEELEMRLLVLSLAAWVLGKLSHTPQGMPSRGALWIATTIAAVIFAAGHLPATAVSVATTPTVVLRSLVLNGGLGLLFGYLYSRRGLEAAVLSHFSADIVIHFIQSLY